ncbi:MAG: hypothetical protein ABR881_30875 [Candidatus Sulfotelmatobacter sp.]
MLRAADHREKNQLVVAGRRGWNSAKFDLLMIHDRIVVIKAKIDIHVPGKTLVLASYDAAHSNRLHDQIMPDSLHRTQTTGLRQT